MKLIEDAGDIWHRLWSLRLSLASGAMGAVAAALPFAAPDHRSVGFALLVFAATLIASLLALASAWARLVRQPKLRGDRNADV